MNKNISKYIISKYKKVEDALKIIDRNGEKTCFIVDEKKRLVGSLTDGDIRRNIFKRKKSIRENVLKFCNKNTKFLVENNYDKEKIKSIFIRKKIELIPILSKNKKIINIISKSENFGFIKKRKKQSQALSRVKIVIMAGGKGQRLDPITRVLPKPLVPLKDKTAIENIMQSFLNYGAKKFYLVLNFKSELIKAYFRNRQKIKYNLNYIDEKKPLGTIGGLEKLKGKINGNFIVSNCDVVFNFDYKNLIKEHIDRKNGLTLVTSKRTSVIPYGVCKVGKEKNLIEIKEKPKYDYLITTGLYVVSSKIIKFIPRKKYLDMNEFIEILKKKNIKIGSFQISKNIWYDIGKIDDYKKRLDVLGV